ncbi:MAG TPA: type VII secretion protein EccCb [Actinomycetota bacterium]|nr:type VII secretion protein EccCb [Actinomycetota bacterium]
MTTSAPPEPTATDDRAAPGAVVFHRPARAFPAPAEGEPVAVAAPPIVDPPTARGFLQVLLPVVGSLSILGFALLYRNPLLEAVAGGIVVLSVVAAVAMHVGQRRASLRQRRRDAGRYHAHLDRQRTRLAEIATVQRAGASRLHPDPAALWPVVADRHHLWERRRGDPDFLHARVGLGTVPLAVPVRLELGTNPLVEYVPELEAAATEVVADHQRLAAMPVTIPAAELGSLAVVGDREAARALVRAVVCQLATWHAPDDLRLVTWFEPAAEAAWSWMKWLPHARETGAVAGTDGRDAVALTVDPGDLDVLLTQLVQPRVEHLERTRAGQVGTAVTPVSFQPAVVVVDGYAPMEPVGRLPILDQLLTSAAELGVLVVTLVERRGDVPARAGAVLELAADGHLDYTELAPDGRREHGLVPDAATVELCEALARAMAPLVLRAAGGRSATVDSKGLLGLLGLDAAARLDQLPTRDGRELLRTPIGIGDDGRPVHLDLKEAAEDGMGPHGLVVGATGSGKSELLRTLVTGLALGHAPEELALVLVDYKGGATFAEAAALPHVAGVITNLEREPTLVDRMHAALFGELERRQRVLAEAGNFDRVRDYQAYRAANPAAGLAPLPSLLVIVDEFGELLAARPDFLDLFVSIGRTGRSLGVHLLLATQRLDEGRIRGLESHLRYRICLRTFSAEESMVALGGREAFELPPLPGLGWLRVDGAKQRFKAALVTRPWREHRELAEAADVVRAFDVGGLGAELAVLLRGGPGDPARPAPAAPVAATAGPKARTELQVAVAGLGRAAGPERRVRPVWLDPLPEALPLDAILDAGATPRRPGDPDWLTIPLGLADRPREQAQVPFVLDLNGTGGHLALVGAPRSGKSTLLASLVVGLALTHDPGDTQVYAIDLGGGRLHALAGLPHVGAVCGRADRERVHRLVRELRAIAAERAEAFRRHGLDGMTAHHRARRDGTLAGGGHGEVLVLIDNWALFASEFADLAEDVLDLAAAGLHYGIHLVVAANRWTDLRLALRDNLGGRLELRLNDPVESEIGRHAAAALPADAPGRGLARSGHVFQAALPRADGLADIGGLALGVERLVAEVAARWRDAPAAPPIRTLPRQVHQEDLPDPATDDRPGVAIGLEEHRLRPARVDLFGDDPHFVVLGDDRCGKTNLLRAWMRRLAASHPPERVRLAVVDYRRQLLDAVDEPYLLGYACTVESAAELARRLAGELAGRLRPADLSVSALRQARTWSGPGLVLVVDDYDLVASAVANPLAGLVEVLAQGRDVGFHLVLARRVGGLARSAFEPMLQRLRELGPPGLVMSGDPDEGPLLGGRKAEPLPPGRGHLVHRRAAVLVQTALAESPPRHHPVPGSAAPGTREG